jgi:hypothetical protein
MERMVAYDDEYIEKNVSRLYGKTLGVLVTGSNDGAQPCMEKIYNFGCQLGFTIPPESFATYLGIPEEDPIEQNEETLSMITIMARNMYAWTKLNIESGIGRKVQEIDVDKKGVVAGHIQ